MAQARTMEGGDAGRRFAYSGLRRRVMSSGFAAACWFDLIERETLAAVAGLQPRRVGILVVRFREHDVHVVVVLGPIGPVFAVPALAGALFQHLLDRRRRAVLIVDSFTIFRRDVHDLLAHDREGGG